jgi:hypothetical protein
MNMVRKIFQGKNRAPVKKFTGGGQEVSYATGDNLFITIAIEAHIYNANVVARLPSQFEV